MKFSELNLNADLQKAIDEAGFTECFPVQSETFQRTLHGRDVTVQSQTGSGKTAAFLITVFQQLATNEKYKGKKALIIVPTRELAIQIEDDAKILGKYSPLKIGSFFGGIGYAQQETLLRNGVDIMIGTPGRLIDFSKQKKINMQDIGILVIDEADRLFDMGFLPDLRKLLRKMPPAEERLTMLLSATLSLRVSTLSWEYMNGAEEIEIDPEQVTVDTVSHVVYHVAHSEKLRLLLGILKQENPRNAIIFTNTKHAAEVVAKRLVLNGYQSQFIIGDLPQKKRLRVIEDLKANKFNFLVATDVAARGLHVEDLDMVVNFDVPEDAENYVHRIGRTGRVGKSGKAVTLACERYVFGLEAIEKYIGDKIPVEHVEESLLAEDKSAGVRIVRERYGVPGREEESPRRGRGREDRSREVRRPRERRPASIEAGTAPQREKRPAAAKTPDAVRRPAPALHAAAPRGPVREPKPITRRGPKKEHSTHQVNPVKKGSGHKMTPEERLAFYKDKYGENFTQADRHHRKKTPASQAKAPAAERKETGDKKPSFITKVFGFLKGKGS